MKLLISSASVLLTAVFLSACGGASDHDFTVPLPLGEAAAPPHGPIFDPANSLIPTTNDLLFAGSTDGTLNLPNPDNNPVRAALNKLDGFSTTIPFTAAFGMSLDPASLTIGESIRVFEVIKNAQGAIIAVAREVTAAEMVAVPTGEGNTTLAIAPLVPLKESTSYLVVLTTGITDPAGARAITPTAYSLARSAVPLTGGNFAALEPLRQLINNAETVAEASGVDKGTIVLTWSFTTQSITPVINNVASRAVPSVIAVGPTGLNTSQVSQGALPGIADVWVGKIDLPYYLEAPSATNPLAPRTGHWQSVDGRPLTRFNTAPIQNSVLSAPIMMTTPNASSGQVKPAAGWPIVIYQHGITRVRTDVLGYADAMAQAGFAVIAMDLPLHGVTPDNPLFSFFHASTLPAAFGPVTEPTFDIDFQNNDTSAPAPDGVADASGAHFINLQSLLTSRDNARQGVANLLTLRKSLVNIAATAPGLIDAERIGVVAHSLGGIVAVPFLALDDKPMPSSLVTTGARIGIILRDSGNFGPPIRAGLEALGITGADYEAFLQAAQWAVDSADPANFAQDASATHPIHMIEIVGDGSQNANNQPDQTVPNQSTDILAALLGATKASAPVNPVTVGAPKIVRFTQGDHSTILTANDLGVFTEMHSELAAFQASGGTAVILGGTSGVVPNFIEQ